GVRRVDGRSQAATGRCCWSCLGTYFFLAAFELVQHSCSRNSEGQHLSRNDSLSSLYVVRRGVWHGVVDSRDFWIELHGSGQHEHELLERIAQARLDQCLTLVWESVYNREARIAGAHWK